jgi:L-arabinose isomerase
MLELYDVPFPELKGTMGRFAEGIAAALADRVEVETARVCLRAEEVEAALRRFEASGCDLVILVLLTYAPSLVSVPALLSTPLPVVIFDTAKAPRLGPEMTGQDIMENHGIHGVQDLANVLAREGRAFQLVVGHWEDRRALDELASWAKAAQVAAKWRRLRVGLLGEPFPGMGDFQVEFQALREAIGPEVVPLDTSDLDDCARKVRPAEVQAESKRLRSEFDIAPSLTDGLLSVSVRGSLALRRLVAERGLGALSMNFLAFHPEPGARPRRPGTREAGRPGARGAGAETVPFLGASQLMAGGIGYAGEGDVCCAALVAASAELCGPAGFTEMFCPDFAAGDVLMSHMGECNLAMARPDRRPLLVAKRFVWAPIREPAVPVFSLAPGPATLASLTAWRDSAWRLVVTEGEVVDTPPYPNLDSPYFKFKPASALPEFLREYSLAGGTHHLAIVFGRRAAEFRKLADLSGIECIQV